MGPLAMVAKQAGYTVSGSDKQDSQYIAYLKKHGIKNIHIGQSREQIETVHKNQPIDWYVYSSAVSKENPNAPEFAFVDQQGIRRSKRDELLNKILSDKNQKLIAIAGTHGKTTTTAMVVWLLKAIGQPISYILPAKTSFADMGAFDSVGQFFVYECDEFDRNFLAFKPHVSLITGVSWDHHEIFPTRDNYNQAFRDFLAQSDYSFIWCEDYDYLGLNSTKKLEVLDPDHPDIAKLTILGRYNRLDAWLAIQAVHEVTKIPLAQLINHINKFPGLQRRMEEIAPGLFSDYAHTPEKIRGGLSAARELCQARTQDKSLKPKPSGKLVIVYEPLTNRRQHHMLNDYGDCFAGADKLYWIPSYLAREDPDQRIIPPIELIEQLADPSIAVAMERDEKLAAVIRQHLAAGDMVVGMAGGGGDSLDEWLRANFV